MRDDGERGSSKLSGTLLNPPQATNYTQGCAPKIIGIVLFWAAKSMVQGASRIRSQGTALYSNLAAHLNLIL